MVITVLPEGYIIDGVSLNTPAEVRGYVIAQQIRDVRVVPQRGVSYDRVRETFVALGDLGLFFGIVGSERFEQQQH
jgi:hypothetical protein